MEVPRAVFVSGGSPAVARMEDSYSEHEPTDAQPDPSVFGPTWMVAVGEAPADMTCSLSGERVLRGQRIYAVVHASDTAVFCSDDSYQLWRQDLVAATTWTFLYRWRRMVKAALANAPDKRGYTGVCPLTFGTGHIARARGAGISAAELDVDWRAGLRLRFDWLLNSMHVTWRSAEPLQSAEMAAFLRASDPAAPHVVLHNIFGRERAMRLAEQFWTELLVHRRRDGRLPPRDLTNVRSLDALHFVDMTRGTGILSEPRYYWSQTCQDVSTDQNVLDAVQQATEARGLRTSSSSSSSSASSSSSSSDVQRKILLPVSPMIRCIGQRYNMLMRVMPPMRGHARSFYGIVVLGQPLATAVLGRVVRLESASGLQMAAMSNAKMAFKLAQPKWSVTREHASSTPARRVFETAGRYRIHVEPIPTGHNSMLVAATDDFIVVFDDFHATMDLPPVMLFWVALSTHSEVPTYNEAVIAQRKLIWPGPGETMERPDVLRHSQFTSIADMVRRCNINYTDLLHDTQTHERALAFFTARQGPPHTRDRDAADRLASEAMFILPSSEDPRDAGAAGSVPYVPPNLSPQGESYHLLRSRPGTWSSEEWVRTTFAPGNQMQLFEDLGYDSDGADTADRRREPTPPLGAEPTPDAEPDVVWQREFRM